jgi:multicomponent Na+:H+ antiporter subunit E
VRIFLYNITLAFLWALLNGEVNDANLLIGFLIGYLILGSMRFKDQKTSYFAKVSQAVRFLLVFLKEMLVSSVRVAYDVITPADHAKPGVIAVPLDAETDAEIALLANVISLTPGTLSLDVSEDRKTLYIHAMFIDNPDALRREIKEGLEKRLLELMR